MLQGEQISCGGDSHDDDDDDDSRGSRGSSCGGYSHHNDHGRTDLLHRVLRTHVLDGVQTVNH